MCIFVLGQTVQFYYKFVFDKTTAAPMQGSMGTENEGEIDYEEKLMEQIPFVYKI